MMEFINTHWISISGTLMGLFYLYMEYKANIWMWLTGIVMAAFFIIIYYNTRLYASMGIYSYFLFGSIYGWVKWLQNRKKNETHKDIIQQAPKKVAIHICLSILLVCGIIYLILIKFTENQGIISVGDALTTSLNIVALWMAARRFAEQWLLLIPANAISTLLLIIQNDIISAVLFFIYFFVSIMGYYRWRNLAIKNFRN